MQYHLRLICVSTNLRRNRRIPGSLISHPISFIAEPIEPDKTMACEKSTSDVLISLCFSDVCDYLMRFQMQEGIADMNFSALSIKDELRQRLR